MLRDDFYMWICKFGNLRTDQPTNAFDIFATRLGNSEMFNGTVVENDNGEEKKHFKIYINACDECGIPRCIMYTRLDKGIQKGIDTYYIDMDTIEGREFFIDCILQRFGIFREIRKVVLYYTGTTAYSAKIFVRHKLIHSPEEVLRNYVCSIELVSQPDQYGEATFTLLEYSNPVKLWNYYDDKDIFDYVGLSGAYGTAVCNYIVSMYGQTTSKKKNTVVANHLKNEPNRFVDSICLRTDSGWKRACEVAVGNKLLMLHGGKLGVSYQSITEIDKRPTMNGMRVFRFVSPNLNVDLPVGFKGDCALGCKPARIGVINEPQNLTIRSQYPGGNSIATLDDVVITRSKDTYNTLAGIFIFCGRFSESRRNTVEFVFKSSADISKILSLLDMRSIEYTTSNESGLILTIKHKQLRDHMYRVYACLGLGNKKYFLTDSTCTISRAKSFLLRGMLLFSEINGLHGEFVSTDRDKIELVQELIIHIEKKIINIEKVGNYYVLRYIHYDIPDTLVNYFECSIGRYTEYTYGFNVEDNRYTLVLARDNSGRAFWIGI